jgi:carbonic anhydrase
MLKSFANWPISRRNVLRSCAFTGLATALSPAWGLDQEGESECPRRCKENPPPETPAKALQVLAKGNERWATFTQCHPHEDRARRMSVVNGQSPFAAILSCSDSRVPPELAFDQGIGDLFVARVAGNCAEGTLTESLYYGTRSNTLVR